MRGFPRQFWLVKEKRLSWEHFAVDSQDLMWERLDQAGMDGEQRVEKIRELDLVCLGYQTEEAAVRIEVPRGPRTYSGNDANYPLVRGQLSPPYSQE